MKIIFALTFVTFLVACGGGGGGTSTSSSSSSSATAITWNTTFTNVRGNSAHFNSSGSGSAYSSPLRYSDDYIFGGASFSASSGGTYFAFESEAAGSIVDPDISATLDSSYITSGPTAVADNYASQNGLDTNNYDYTYYDSSIAKNTILTVAVPTNYSNQVWFYWDNTNQDPSDYVYNFAVTGNATPFASIPASGTATYNGGIEGVYTISGQNTVSVIAGSSTFNVNWATQQISGSFHSLRDRTLGTGFNTLTMGATSISSSTGHGDFATFSGELTGTGFNTYSWSNNIYGTFYGSSAESLGGTWELTNNSASGNGAGYFAAKR